MKIHKKINQSWIVLCKNGIEIRSAPKASATQLGILCQYAVIKGTKENNWIKHKRGWSMISKNSVQFLTLNSIGVDFDLTFIAVTGVQKNLNARNLCVKMTADARNGRGYAFWGKTQYNTLNPVWNATHSLYNISHNKLINIGLYNRGSWGLCNIGTSVLDLSKIIDINNPTPQKFHGEFNIISTYSKWIRISYKGIVKDLHCHNEEKTVKTGIMKDINKNEKFDVSWWATFHDIDSMMNIISVICKDLLDDLLHIMILYCRNIPIIQPSLNSRFKQNRLNLSNDHVNEVTMDAIGYLLSQNSTLTYLFLPKNITTDGARSIGCGLKTNTTLRTIKINHDINIGNFHKKKN